jgi:hypothetical protein
MTLAQFFQTQHAPNAIVVRAGDAAAAKILQFVPADAGAMHVAPYAPLELLNDLIAFRKVGKK